MITVSHSHQRKYPPFRPRFFGLTATLVVATLGLSACGSVDDPTQAAEQFAEQLSSEQLKALEGVDLADGSTDRDALVEAIAELENFPVEVTLDSVVEDDSDDSEDVTATADYTVTWDLSGGHEADTSDDASNETEDAWTYATQATLIWDEESEVWEPQLTSATLVAGLAETGSVQVSETPAERGEILDAHDEPLTTERPVQRIGIDKTHLVDELSAGGAELDDDEVMQAATDSATALAEALELDVDTFVDRVLAAGDRAWVEFIVLRDDG